MPNPDDEPTNAKPPGPELSAPGGDSTTSPEADDPSAHDETDLTEVSGSLVESSVGSGFEVAATPDSSESELIARAAPDLAEAQLPDTAEDMEPGDCTSSARHGGDLADAEDTGDEDVTLEADAADEIPSDAASDDSDHVFEDSDRNWVDALEDERSPGWEVLDRDGDDERTYDWPTAPGVKQRARPLAWIDWRFSLLFPVAIAGVLLTFLWSLVSVSDTIQFQVVDAGTGEAIAGARLAVGNDIYEAGPDGVVVIERPASPAMVDVAADGYYSVQGEVDDTVASDQDVELRPREMERSDSFVASRDGMS